MPGTDNQPTQQMLDNLDLLLSMDMLLNEADWKVVEKLNSPTTASQDGHGNDDDEDEDDD